MILSDLRKIHEGETIWVLGSGPTMNFIDADFFSDKVVVSANYGAKILGVSKYHVFTHYHEDAKDLCDEALTVVTLSHDTNTHRAWSEDKPDNLILIDQPTYEAPGSSWDPNGRHVPLDNSLVYGSSSFHGAMHLGAWMGASFLVLVGADCGTLDNHHRMEGYPAGDTPWALYDRHHKMMKVWLEKEYGTRTYSLNPFINFNLEGHTFQGV